MKSIGRENIVSLFDHDWYTISEWNLSIFIILFLFDVRSKLLIYLVDRCPLKIV